jgi:hypothetical protein
MGCAPYSSFNCCVTVATSPSGTSIPGHPYHWKLVVLLSPLKPVTRPPEDMEKLYSPSSFRFIVIGKRLDMRSSRRSPVGFESFPDIFFGGTKDRGLQRVSQGECSNELYFVFK